MSCDRQHEHLPSGKGVRERFVRGANITGGVAGSVAKVSVRESVGGIEVILDGAIEGDAEFECRVARFVNAAEAREGSVDDKFDVVAERSRVTLAVVVREAVDFPKLRDLQANRQLHRLLRQ